MSLTLSSNLAANKASLDLSKASDALRNSLNRLSSGKRIVNSYDDPGGMSVAYKLQSRLRRTEAVRHNVQNSISFLQVQDGVLASAGNIVSRISELRTMAQDVTKNTSDIENYSKEFLELQKQLSQMYNEKFNGVSLFSISGASAVSPPNGPFFNKGTMMDENGNVLTKFSRTIYTHDSGQMNDGNVSIGATNFEDVFRLGKLDSRYVSRFKGEDANLSNPSSINLNTDPNDLNPTIPASAPEGAAYLEIGTNSDLRIYSKDEPQTNGNNWRLFIKDDVTGTTGGAPSLGVIDSGTETHFVLHLPNNLGDYDFDFLETFAGEYFSVSIQNDLGSDAASYFGSFASASSETILNGEKFGNGYLPSGYSDVFTDDGYLSNILFVSMGQFTSVIERIADARAENGAEQSRLQMVDELLATNVTNLEAAHGRIMDVDVAMESTKFARYNVMVQAAASMVAQANQLSSIALTLLGR